MEEGKITFNITVERDSMYLVEYKVEAYSLVGAFKQLKEEGIDELDIKNWEVSE